MWLVAGARVRLLLRPFQDAHALDAKQDDLNGLVVLWLDLLDLRQRANGIGVERSWLIDLGVASPTDKDSAVRALSLADRQERGFAVAREIDGAARAGKDNGILQR